MKDQVIVLNFDSSYSASIASKLRAERISARILPGSTSAEQIMNEEVLGVIRSGGSGSEAPVNLDGQLLRSGIPVLAFTPEDRVRSQLSLTWGVETFRTLSVQHTDEMVRQVDEALLTIGRVEEGDRVVIIAGSPPGIPGSTNALRIHRIGDAINEVAPAYRRRP